MPTKVPKAGHRRSGQGVAPPALQKPIVKSWDPPRPTFPATPSHGGGPSMAADTNASLRMSYHHSEEDSYTGGDDVLWPRETDEEGEAGCDSAGNCRAPRGDMVGEELLRQYVREVSLNEFDTGKIAKTGAHLALDVCGALADLTGVGAEVGAACDAVNSLSYAVEGKYLFAVLSLISAIPVIGDVIGKGGKIGVWLTKTFPKGAERVAKYGPGVVDKIRQLKSAIEANEMIIDQFFKAVEDDEKLAKIHPHLPKMKKALDVFMSEGQGERDQKDAAVAIKKSQAQAEATQRWFKTLIAESEIIDEDEEEEDEPPIDEFSSVGGGSISGYTQPLGMKPPKVGKSKRKKSGNVVRGFKPTHG